MMDNWQRLATDKLSHLNGVTKIVAKRDGTIEFRIGRAYDEKLPTIIERVNNYISEFGDIYRHSGVWAKPPLQSYVEVFIRPNPKPRPRINIGKQDAAHDWTLLIDTDGRPEGALPESSARHLLLSILIRERDKEPRTQSTKAWYIGDRWRVANPDTGEIEPLEKLAASWRMAITPHAWKPWPTPPVSRPRGGIE